MNTEQKFLASHLGSIKIILKEARDFIATCPLCKGATFARDRAGRPALPSTEWGEHTATSWSLAGALCRSAGCDGFDTDEVMAAGIVLTKLLLPRHRTLAQFNDDPATTRADMLALLDPTIECLATL